MNELMATVGIGLLAGGLVIAGRAYFITTNDNSDEATKKNAKIVIGIGLVSAGLGVAILAIPNINFSNRNKVV